MRAQQAGALGPGPVADQITHSRAFAAAWDTAGWAPPESVVDLGTGGGIPGLVLADQWPDTRVVLLDARLARVSFLSNAVTELGWDGRVTAVHARAEDYGQKPAHREAVALAVARGFGPPAVTAECAAPLVEVSGLLLVSEPPFEAGRWPPDVLQKIGLQDEGTAGSPQAHIRVLRKVASTDERYPRRTAAQQRRPLW